MKEEKRHRLVWMDTLKGALILLVVLGHSIQYCNEAYATDHLWRAIYSFHMPAFVALSGWMACYKGLPGSIWRSGCRRAKQLVLPYVVWSIASLMLGGRLYPTDWLIMVTQPDGVFWFLWVLFWIAMFMNVAKWTANRLHIDDIWCIGFMVLAMSMLSFLMHSNAYGLAQIGYFFCFYAFGHFICRWQNVFNKYTDFEVVRGRISVALLTISWGVGAWYWVRTGLPDFMTSISGIASRLSNYAFRVGVAACAVITMICVAPRCLDTDNYLTRVLSCMGRISMGVYIVHLLIIEAFIDLCHNAGIFHTPYVLIAMVFIIVTIVSAVAVLAMRKIPLLKSLV